MPLRFTTCGPLFSGTEIGASGLIVGSPLIGAGEIVIVNDCGPLVSAPPPESWATIVIVAVPDTFAAGVNVSVPAGEIDGGTAKSEPFRMFVTLKLTVWLASFAGPAEIAVAQLPIACAGAL